MKIFKGFWQDLSQRSRFYFGCKYVFPAAAAVLTWGCLANSFESKMAKDQLVLHMGKVSDVSIVFEQGAKRSYKYYPLMITLEGSPKVFRLRDNFKDWFPLIQDRVHVGDIVKIYTRTKFRSLISWGRKNDIYQIENSNELLFPLIEFSNYNISQAKFLLVLALIFWTPFILYKVKIINPD